MGTINKKLSISSKHLQTIIAIFDNAGAQIRLVGGAVRDALLGAAVADIDLASNFLPEEAMNLLRNNGVKVIPTGIKFGTVTAIIEDESFEITTLRADLDCDGRHAKVQYSKDFEEDAARRDFTINALSYCPVNHVIYDYFGGLADINQRRVRFIGDPKKRIQEDYLRILRFFRFSCRFAEEIDKEGLEACARFKGEIKTLSRERIKSELDLILSLDRSVEVLPIMSESGVLQEILPIDDYNQSLHKRALKIASEFEIGLHLPVIYAVLLNKIEGLSLKRLLDLRFSRAEARAVLNILSLEGCRDDTKAALERLKSIWLDEKEYVAYFVYASLLVHDPISIHNLYKKLSVKKKPSFPVNGAELEKLGYKGKELGSALDYIKQAWVASDFTLTSKQLINLGKNNEK